ncbi:MAG: DsbE family thiol:disulfide interchange protein [Pseudomonadota bacterium]
MNKRLIFLIPVLLFLGLAGVFMVGLGRDPSYLPSMLIDRPAPEFDLAPIEGQTEGLSSEDLKGTVSLVNVFGSWCIACTVEHPVLMEIAREGTVPIFGIDWKDKAGAGTAWLQRHGNPYTKVGDDAAGRVAIDFGVSGAPETFVVDSKGNIRHKHVGPISVDDWENVLGPMVRDLQKSGPEAGPKLGQDARQQAAAAGEIR